MRARFLLHCGLCFVLMLGIVVFAARLVDHLGGGRVDLGGGNPGTLTAATRRVLRESDESLTFTYFVSPRQRMPSRYKGLEKDVRALLQALQAAAPHKVRFRVLYPEAGGAAARSYAARLGASAVTVHYVEHDEHGERRIWSTLALQHDSGPPILIKRLQPEGIGDLQALLRAHLQALTAPPAPVFAVSAPPGYGMFMKWLSGHGKALSVDLDLDPRLPSAADVLFWIQPRVVTAEHTRLLRNFVASGRSVVLAGSSYEMEYLGAGDSLVFRARDAGTAWADLLRPLGLTPVADLLLDTPADPLQMTDARGTVRTLEAPFQLRCLPIYRDMHEFAAPARGGLSFVAASAIGVDQVRVAAAGYSCTVVATTTEKARVLPLPQEPVSMAALAGGQPVGRRNLMVLLNPHEALSGRILVLASATLLQDGILGQAGHAHRVFLGTLLRSFAGPGQLVQARCQRAGPAALPPLQPGQRIFWRLLSVGLAPAILVAVGLWRLRVAGLGGHGYGVLRVSGLAMLAVLTVSLLGQLAAAGRGPRWDWSQEQLSRPGAQLGAALDSLAADLHVELFISPRAALPRLLKRVPAQLGDLLRAHGVALQVHHPELLTDKSRTQLLHEGLTPLPVEQVRHDSLLTRQVWCGLRLRYQGRSTLIPHLDARALRHREFLLAAALWRLRTGVAPQVAVVAAPPRLSPAEAMEDYQRKGLIAPGGVDVYSGLKALLSDYGYAVRYVDARAPQWSAADTLILWLQPRRDSTPIATHLARYLHDGGRALVAVQHYNIQQRQYRGTGFQTVYWPQPQFADINPYLRELGVEQVREVLMDRTQAHLLLETQVNRTARREYDPQQVALPFLIRAVPAYYAPDAALTRHLGDLLFLWGNRFVLDSDRLRANGLTASVLVTTSPSTWAYDWHGGWLPPEAFAPTELLDGPQPLIVCLTGSFPALEPQPETTGRTRWTSMAASAPGAPGRLLLIGCSQMFQDGQLKASGFDHDQLLLNGVAWLTYGEELAALQARRPTVRGFAYQSPAVKGVWRLLVTATGPGLFLLLGLARWRAWRRVDGC